MYEISANDHILIDLIINFEQIYVDNYLYFLKIENILSEVSLFQEVMILINLVENLLTQFYYRFIRDKFKFLKKRNFEEVIISISNSLILERQKIFNLIYHYFKIKYKEEKLQIEYIMKKLEKIKPKNLGIRSEFLLEEENTPYEKVIIEMRNISEKHCAYLKFQQIFKIKDLICLAIDKYWEKKKKVNKKNIDADQLMNIFIFCIIKTKNSNLIIDYKFIEALLSEDLLNFGEKAYYFNIFSTSLEFLKNLKNEKEELDTLINKIQN